MILGTAGPIVIGMLLALLLWRRPKGFTLFRTFYFMPQVVSAVVIGIVWNWIYNPIFGILNKGLDAVGLEYVSRGWLGDPDVALYAILVAGIWAEIGFVFVIFLAGLQNVSKDLLEAATIDGANVWQRFRHVTMPQMANVINIVVAIELIGGFNVFDMIFMMGGGAAGRDRGDRHLHLQGGLHPEQHRLCLDPGASDDHHLAGRLGRLHQVAGTPGGLMMTVGASSIPDRRCPPWLRPSPASPRFGPLWPATSPLTRS